MSIVAKKDDEFNFSDKKVQEIIDGIYAGDITPTELPEELYEAIAKYLNSGAKKGFGEINSGVEWAEKDEALVESLQENIYIFSAAKTFQQTLEMSEALVNEEGELRSQKEFTQAARDIFTRYNGGELDGQVKPGWIQAEYNSAVIQSGNARKWSAIERDKEVLPYLLYNALDNACEICAPLDGVCLPVDDPFWDKYMPENHFNCLCIVEQVEKQEGEQKESSNKEVEDVESNNKVPDDFKYNPGKRGEVFLSEGPNKHPYFSVPKEYAKLAQNNFNLPI